MVGMLLFPLLGFVFAFADDIVTLIYTGAYVDAAPVMRVYVIGMLALVVELNSVLQLLRQGMFNLRVSVIILGVSVPLSWAGGVELGLAGAAIGSACALYLDRLLVLRRIAAVTGVPVRSQQHWASLARHLAWTVIATLGAWLAGHHLFADSPIIVRLAMGGAVLAAVYGPMNWKHLRNA
jgi:O-antigen/teichoic acid export membrane protein